jgi:hypothetical protein
MRKAKDNRGLARIANLAVRGENAGNTLTSARGTITPGAVKEKLPPRIARSGQRSRMAVTISKNWWTRYAKTTVSPSTTSFGSAKS